MAIRENNKKEKKFLQMPEYPGGRKALREFISSQLQYPQDAIVQNIQGTVVVAYMVNDEGNVENARVVQSLFPSCDEEAIRLVSLLKYTKAYNHGVRVKANQKLHVHFKCKPEQKKTVQLQYAYASSLPNRSEASKHKEPTEYTYSILFNVSKTKL